MLTKVCAAGAQSDGIGTLRVFVDDMATAVSAPFLSHLRDRVLLRLCEGLSTALCIASSTRDGAGELTVG